MLLGVARIAAREGGVRVQAADHLYGRPLDDSFGVIVKVTARKGSLPRVHVLMDKSKEVRIYFAEDVYRLAEQGGST